MNSDNLSRLIEETHASPSFQQGGGIFIQSIHTKFIRTLCQCCKREAYLHRMTIYKFKCMACHRVNKFGEEPYKKPTKRCKRNVPSPNYRKYNVHVANPEIIEALYKCAISDRITASELLRRSVLHFLESKEYLKDTRVNLNILQEHS